MITPPTVAPPESRWPCPVGPTVRLVEVLVFLFLIAPSLVFSFVVTTGAISFTFLAVSTIFRDLGLLGLILFFLWRDGDPVARIGWTTRNLGKELLLGLVLFPLVDVGAGLLETALRRLGLPSGPPTTPPFLLPSGPAEIALAVGLTVVVAITEETIFRGYLIDRFATITQRCGLAVLLSSIIFSLGHGYEGTVGVITVGAVGLILALLYVWRHSLVAPITIHFLLDAVALVLVPLLGPR